MLIKDNQSLDYDHISRIYNVSRAANAETVAKLIRLLRVDYNSVLLDMGCGTGNYTAALAKVAKSAIGIDISMGMIEQARIKFSGSPFICGDITHLPFNSEMFDGVFAIQVLHHIREKETFLKEAHRLLRKGAYIAIHSCSHEQMQAFWFCHYFPKGLEIDLARTPNTEQIKSMLKRTGFSNIGIEICYQDIVVARETPESYLDKNYRDGISTFAFLKEEEIELGCKKLREDITSGNVERVVRQSEQKIATIGGSSIVYGKKI